MNTSIPNSQQQSDEKQETIFDELVDLSAYEKSIKGTRTWLYIVAVIWLIWGIVNYNKFSDLQIGMIIFLEYLFVSAAFFGFAIWSRWKPAAAFLVAIIFYVLLNVWLYSVSGFDITSIALRIFIIISVVRGYLHARKYEELKRMSIENEY